MLSWIQARWRLVLLAAVAGGVLTVAGGLYLKGRHDAAQQAKVRVAEAAQAVQHLELQGAQQSATRTAAAVSRRDTAASIAAQATVKAQVSEDAHAPLSADRAARLRAADLQLCDAAPALRGCPAGGHAG